MLLMLPSQVVVTSLANVGTMSAMDQVPCMYTWSYYRVALNILTSMKSAYVSAAVSFTFVTRDKIVAINCSDTCVSATSFSIDTSVSFLQKKC